jgi:hypothetical protein
MIKAVLEKSFVIRIGCCNKVNKKLQPVKVPAVKNMPEVA